MHPLRRVQFVTKRFLHLQGLRLVPVGLFFLGAGAWRDGHLGWLPGAAGPHAVLWSGGYVVALIAAVALGRYYRLRYGSVQSRLNLPAVFSALVVAVLLAGAVWMQNTQPWHASLPLVVIGLAIAAVGVAGGCVRWHYLAVAAATVAFATLETFVSTDARYVLLDYLIGGGLIVIGIGDHLLLRNALEPYPDARTI